MRAHVLRAVIRPVNVHRSGHCVFPVLCMYDDLLIQEAEDGTRASWRYARTLRHAADAVWEKLAEEQRRGH